MRPDLCATNCSRSPREFSGKFYTDSLVHDPDALRLLVDVIGKVLQCFDAYCQQKINIIKKYFRIVSY